MNRISFISYDGEYPNLCSGKLILSVDGVKVEFPKYCMSSGGSVSFDEEWNEEVTDGDWEITRFPEGFPKELEQEAINVVNANVHKGCCGGCV